MLCLLDILNFKASVLIHDKNNPCSWINRVDLKSNPSTNLKEPHAALRSTPELTTRCPHKVLPIYFLRSRKCTFPHRQPRRRAKGLAEPGLLQSTKGIPLPSPLSPSPFFSCPSPVITGEWYPSLPALINTVSPCLQACREFNSLEILVVHSLRSQIKLNKSRGSHQS